jgi:hypothetical protein
MKIKSIFVAILLLLGFSQNVAQANVRPIVESFTFSPSEIELTSSNTRVEFELVVSHPNGIDNLSTIATLTNSNKDTLKTFLTRTDSPINQLLSKVTFRGALTIPSNVKAGVYTVTAESIKNNPVAGYQFETGTIEGGKIRELVGATSGLLVRNDGLLNLSYETFVGPAYDLSTVSKFSDFRKASSLPAPILRVGETLNLGNYFELKVPSLSLNAITETPTVCPISGLTISFNSQGVCSLKIFTKQDSNYEKFQVSQILEIRAARLKPTLVVNEIQNIKAVDLPRLITLPTVYSSTSGFIPPKSESPNVCTTVGTSVRVTSGGTCVITYQTEESYDYLASDLYKITFEITRDPQTITFTLPSTANVSLRSIALAATASSGGAITYSTTSAGICSITGSTLNLLGNGNCAVTATQAGTSTVAPASATATVILSGATLSNRKTITCVKGKSTKRVSGVNPKCPRGFKIKR